jgi:hypothetical protein
MIAMSQFRLLCKSEQIRVLNKFGSKLSERISGGNRFYLYSINGFYIELLHEFAVVNSQGLTITRVFDDVNCLDPYLEMIDIKELAGTIH